MSMTSRTPVALAVAAIVLPFAGWFDTTVAFAILERSFGDNGVSAALGAAGVLFIAGSGLLLGTLAWRSASAVVGLAYVVVGGFFVALPWLYWTFGIPASVYSPGGPGPVATIIVRIYDGTSGGGRLVMTISAAMLIAGVAALVRWWRVRAFAPHRTQVVVPAEPMRL